MTSLDTVRTSRSATLIRHLVTTALNLGTILSPVTALTVVDGASAALMSLKAWLLLIHVRGATTVSLRSHAALRPFSLVVYAVTARNASAPRLMQPTTSWVPIQ